MRASRAGFESVLQDELSESCFHNGKVDEKSEKASRAFGVLEHTFLQQGLPHGYGVLPIDAQHVDGGSSNGSPPLQKGAVPRGNGHAIGRALDEIISSQRLRARRQTCACRRASMRFNRDHSSV